jgi:hypothetical protein
MRLPASLISWCAVFLPRLLFSRRTHFVPEFESIAMPRRAVDPAEELRKTLCTLRSCSSGRVCRSFWFKASSSFSRSIPARSRSSSNIGVSPSPSPLSSVGVSPVVRIGVRIWAFCLLLLGIFVRVLDFLFLW